MNNLSSVSLNGLLKVAQRMNLIDHYRTTDWVAFLSMDGRELALTHVHARFFLQGLIYGAAMKNRRSNPASRTQENSKHAVNDSKPIVLS